MSDHIHGTMCEKMFMRFAASGLLILKFFGSYYLDFLSFFHAHTFYLIYAVNYNLFTPCILAYSVSNCRFWTANYSLESLVEPRLCAPVFNG